MTEQEYVLCTWRKRLWPAKVLCKNGVAGKRAAARVKETFFEVEILGLKEQVLVSCTDAVPLKEECIKDIASSLEQRNDSREAVEELKYRHALKLALELLAQNGSGRPAAQPQEQPAGALSSAPSWRSASHCKEKPGPEAPKKRRGDTNAFSPKTAAKSQGQKGSTCEERSGANPARCAPQGLAERANPESQNCQTPGSRSLPRHKTIKPSLLAKCSPGNELSLKPKEEKRKQGRKGPRAAGSAGGCGGESPQGQAQPLAEERSPPWGPWEPARRVNTRSQPERTFLEDSSSKSALDNLEKSISGESESLVKQLDGRKKPKSSKWMNGEQEVAAAVSSGRKRKCRSYPEPSSAPSDPGMLSESFPCQPPEEGAKNAAPVLPSETKQFQLPAFEEEEGLELPELSAEAASSESLPHLPAQLEEEEEDEELPSILSPQEPQVIEEGVLVWCKLRRYPYWPAVVKNVKRKHRKACVLLIDRTLSEKKKGFSVPLKNLKHFDCEERQELIEGAKADFQQEIEWCIRLISDYRIRIGCHSFTGSFLEYFAADISHPVRKEGYQDLVHMPFPKEAEAEEWTPSQPSPPRCSKKLLPDRSRAARDRANKKLVEFIVKSKGAEEHLLAILKSRKHSRWLQEFLSSTRYMSCVETYLEDEEQLDLVVNYLKEVYQGIDAKNHRWFGGDGIKLILDVLLPEAIIYAISAVDDIDYKKAEEKYIRGPSVSNREREIFEEEILERERQSKPASPGSC